MLTDKEKFISLVNNDCINKSDAIILLEGDGFNRYPEAVRLFHEGFANMIVFSGGITDYNYGSYPFHEILPLLLKCAIPYDSIIHEKISKNTQQQAVEVIKLAQKSNWKKLILIASHYHQYRAYLTFLKEILTNRNRFVLYNAPCTSLKWFDENPWGKRIDLIDYEFEKIENYTKYGHLATFKQAIEYQKWKEQQAL